MRLSIFIIVLIIVAIATFAVILPIVGTAANGIAELTALISAAL